MNPTVKGALVSKTMWIAATITALGVIEANQAALVAYVPQYWQAAATIALGIAVGVVRAYTTQSLADKGTPQ